MNLRSSGSSGNNNNNSNNNSSSNNNARPGTPPLPDDDIPTDRYGPLNRYSGNRNSNYNPGGQLSAYNRDGTPKTDIEMEDNSDALNDARYALINAMPLEDDQIAAIEAHVAVEQPLRRSLRAQGIPADNNDCTDQICLITHTRLALGDGIRLSDGRCYDVRAITAWYDMVKTRAVNQQVLPTRKPFEPADISLINDIRGGAFGGKKKRKGSRSRKGRKTRKGGKTRKGRRGRKTKKTRKSRK